MFLVEKFSTVIASKIASVTNLEEEHEEILAYGAFAALYTIFSMAWIVIFGIVFNVLADILIISTTASILRKYSGGAHATSPNRCAAIGVVIFGGLTLIGQDLSRWGVSVVIGLNVVCFVLTYYLISLYAPVDTPNKPITKQTTKQRLRKQSLKLVSFLLFINIILWGLYLNFKINNLLSVIISLSIGIGWQSITLTKIGYFIISNLDALFRNINLVGGVHR